jgi:hypothetical protein
MKKIVSLAILGFIASSCIGTGRAAPSIQPLPLNVQLAFAGDEIRVDYKIVDKTKFGITLENNNTKIRTHLTPNNFVWNGPNLSIKLPSDMLAGSYTVSLQENGVAVAESSLGIKVHPVLTSPNLEGVIPGQPVVIQGAGFSSKPSDNLVEFTTINENVDSLGGMRFYDGPVATYRAVPTDATPTTLTVVAPQEVAAYVTSQVSAPTRVTVKVNGIQAVGEIKIYLSIREWERGPTHIQVH